MANSSSLREVVEQLFGWSIDTELERFDLPGWYYVGQPPPAECPVCGEGLYAFRYLHERESGTTTLYWALVCSSCADSFEPADLGEAKRELYELSKQGQFRDPVTLDSPPVPAKKPAARTRKAPAKAASKPAPKEQLTEDIAVVAGPDDTPTDPQEAAEQSGGNAGAVDSAGGGGDDAVCQCVGGLGSWPRRSFRPGHTGRETRVGAE